MKVPDEVLDYLAKRYEQEYVDPSKCPFATWAAVQAERMGYRF